MKYTTNNSNIVIFFITAILFSLSYIINIANIIIYTLSFLILMEVIRTIYEYIFNEEHKINLKYVMDGGVLFGIRELFVGWVMIKTDPVTAILIMTISLITIGALIFYRYKIVIHKLSIIKKEEE
ncbi:MAG: hypothetical protein HOF69_05920 [Campylobacteraceae bacterium]|jgi:uncharacterized membrane protein (DUF373 family)|nr:hypothetical protein [Campylobacteraceae bacterium]MBT4030746.1 hypothetical protein [Campylobacteraceae bacterium]MBT5323108.1 hypothetical protein [Campylobacteraceae bacterium]MBT6107841.1 hypothetical protein [Campylobacteraceae bacterium]MBT6389505.1 hypothetical protein [Campylobacteraceae bacterium]